MPVDTKLKVIEKAEDKLALVDALWGGTDAMRDAGIKYLPKEPAEQVEDWKIRRDRSTLTNFFRKTITTMAGRLFSEPVNVKDAAPQFEAMADNVDMEGRNLHRFGYDMTKSCLRDGARFIVIDAPQAEGVQTRADEEQAGIRPYMVDVDIRSVIGWKTAMVAGNRVLTQFRYMEMATEEGDEFTDEEVEQIRVIEPRMVRLYRKDGKGKWYLHQEIPTSIDFVPVVPVYAGRVAFMEFEPPLMDLAWLNVEHWQKSSDQSNILHVARVPILHWAGYTPQTDANGTEVQIAIGPNTLARSRDSSARLEYVEHSGAAIGAGREDLLDIEARAISMGAEFVSPNRPGDMTATEKSINESGDISELSAFAQNLKDSLELAFVYIGKMIGQEFTGYVDINTELGIIDVPPNYDFLIKLRGLRDISRESLYEIINSEWGTALNAQDEQERLNSEPPVGGSVGLM